MSFIENIKKLAKSDIKTIVLPEGTDERVLLGGVKAIEEGYAKVIFVGKYTPFAFLPLKQESWSNKGYNETKLPLYRNKP